MTIGTVIIWLVALCFAGSGSMSETFVVIGYILGILSLIIICIMGPGK